MNHFKSIRRAFQNIKVINTKTAMEKVYSVVTVRGVLLDFNCWKAFLSMSAMSVTPIGHCFYDWAFFKKKKMNHRGINSWHVHNIVQSFQKILMSLRFCRMDGKFFPCELHVLSYNTGYCWVSGEISWPGVHKLWHWQVNPALLQKIVRLVSRSRHLICRNFERIIYWRPFDEKDEALSIFFGFDSLFPSLKQG